MFEFEKSPEFDTDFQHLTLGSCEYTPWEAACGSPTWVAWAQTLEPHSTAFPNLITGSCFGSGTGEL